MDSLVLRPSWPRGGRDGRDPGTESLYQTGPTSEIRGGDRLCLISHKGSQLQTTG